MQFIILKNNVKKIRLFNKRFVSIFVIIIILMIIGYISYIHIWNKNNQKNFSVTKSINDNKITKTVIVEKPQFSPILNRIDAGGDISAYNEICISTNIGGLHISKIYAEVGDIVKKGQKLAELENDLLISEKNQAIARLLESQALLEEAKINSSRAISAVSSGILSKQDIDHYIYNEKFAKSRVYAAKAALDLQELRIKYTTILAPESGIISARFINSGSVVNIGTEIFKLIPNGRLEWRAEITAEDTLNLKLQSKANIILPNNLKITGKLRQISPTINSKTRYAIAYVDIAPEYYHIVKAGMFVRGYFELGEQYITTLPSEAILIRNAMTYVMKLIINENNNQVSLIPVETGKLIDGNKIEIKGTLNNNDLIVVKGALFLNDGDFVNVQ